MQSRPVIVFTGELNRDATNVSGKFLDKDLLFFRSEKPSVWYSLAGIDVETTPGGIRTQHPGGHARRSSNTHAEKSGGGGRDLQDRRYRCAGELRNPRRGQQETHRSGTGREGAGVRTLHRHAPVVR